MNNTYLEEILLLQKTFKTYGMQVFVGGGLAIDGFLRKETREHEDLDIDIVGEKLWKDGDLIVEEVLNSIYNIIQKKNGHFEILHLTKKIDIEYVQDMSENNLYKYKFGVGLYTFPIPLYIVDGGLLNSIEFGIENPYFIFAIKYLMPISGTKKFRKKDQIDIDNLLPTLNKQDLIQALRFQLNYIESEL